jgi:predicted DCC family thiol-disulfide oxidoreductase YuxK
LAGNDKTERIKMHKESSITVFFNSACPVCDAGISFQKKKMEACRVEWKDVHLHNDLVKTIDADLEFVRERLHVIDESGQLHIGYNAFIAIWHHSPNERWKAKLSSLPVVLPVLNMIYNAFAKVLYQWNRSKRHG